MTPENNDNTSASQQQQSIGGKAGFKGGASTTSTGITGPSFDSMYEQKRSTDPTSNARRASIAEQKPPKGLVGSLVDKVVSGPGGPNTSGQ